MTEPQDQEPKEQGARRDDDTSTVADPELDVVRRERDQAQDQLKRSLADLANVRRRQQQEIDRAQGAALEGLAHDLLPVIDHFEAALAAHDQTSASTAQELTALVQGVQMVRAQLAAALERHGLREVPAAGEPFDPKVHEAVGLDPTAEVAPGHVARVLQSGYYLGDRLLRPSRVLVKGPGDPPADPASDAD